MAKGKVFISAVTSEFGKVRSAIASNLRAKGWTVTVQDDFRAEPGSDTLLQFIRDQIYDCDRVVCIVGKRSGACPQKPEAERFEFPRVLPNDFTEASYTEWELFFARRYNKKFSLYIAGDNYVPDKTSGTDVPSLQDAYVKHLKAQGLHYASFSVGDQLRAAILTEDWEGGPTNSMTALLRTTPIVLPYPSIGPLFKGRHNILKQLRDSLTRNESKTATFNALYGMGGVGKTRAAVEYAHAHRDDYTRTLFVVGETPEGLRRNMAALSPTLVPDLDTADDTARLNAVLDWLNKNSDWLLILDNLDTRETLTTANQLLAHCRGHVIITSRLSNFPAEFKSLELYSLTDDDSRAFLLERTEGRRVEDIDDRQKMYEIARELGNLALALEQAGAYIAARNQSFAQYLEQWRSNREKLMAWSAPEITHYSRIVAVTWQTSVDQLTPVGRRLLNRLAWLAPEPLPKFLLEISCPGESESLDDALVDLATYSLVTRAGSFFSIHRLVQDATRLNLNNEERQVSLKEALTWLNTAFAGDAYDVRSWPRLEPLAAHAQTVTRFAESAHLTVPTTELMANVAALLKTKALHAEAEPLMRRALKIDENRLGPEHSEVAERLNNLAQLLKATNRMAEAEPLMRRALAIDEKNLGPDHPKVATRLNNLGILLHETGRMIEAEPLLRRALASDEQSHAPDDPILAVRLNNLARLLQYTNRVSEAEPLMRRSLAIGEKTFGPDHPKVATRLNNLAILLLQQTNQPDEVEPLFRRALEIDQKSLGARHPDVAIDYSNLSRFLVDANRTVEAAPLIKKAISIFTDFQRQTGHPHPRFQAAINNYTAWLKATGKTDTEIKAAIGALTYSRD